MVFLDKYGWPVECIKGRPVINFIRRVLHTRSIRRGRFTQRHLPVDEVNCAKQAVEQVD